MIDGKNENMCRGTNLEAYSVVCLLFLRSTCLFLTVPIKRFFVCRYFVN